jgi:two-component system, cell cycle sensor histidine kinase PleC
MGSVSTYLERTAADNAEIESSELLKDRTVFFSVALVGLVVCIAALFELAHLWTTERLSQTLQTAIAVLLAVFGAIIVLVIASKGKLLGHVAWTVFFAGGLYLFTIINTALFLQHDVAIAIQHSIWLLPIQICLFATLSRQTAFILSCIIVTCFAMTLGVYCWVSGINPFIDEETASLVHILITQTACVVLIVGLASFRESAVARGARVQALKETTDMLAIAADGAEVAREHAVFALAQAETANRTREAFLATMSHELRTPLNAIIGFSQMLEMGIAAPPPTEQQKDYLGDIRQSGEHMLSLINRLLEFSRLNADGCDIRFETHSLTVVAEQAIRMVDVLAVQKSVNLESDWPASETFDVETDDSAVLQILVNLLSNAVKFTPSNGSVCLRLSFAPDDGVVIEVKDTGIGIPADMLESICQPFVQVGDPMRAEVSGTGLGLSIVTKLVDLLGGTFDLESELGQGTSCRVYLPVAQDQEAGLPVSVNV